MATGQPHRQLEHIEPRFLSLKMIKSTDLLPKQLCFTCVKKLNTISEFVEDCVKAEEKLKNNAKTNFFSNQNLFQSYENKINTFAEEPFEICRLCAKNAKKIIYIFDDTGSMQQLEFKINAYLPITCDIEFQNGELFLENEC
ncbi:uncharacterized protein LOC124613459 [Schistocerca americana]|uniref:uncharacterized protein LOC124613459 n=1 Tax=Schistocerca americana TaxID=7009 RepID=UPI001F4F5CD8|nr:uncharacterized protein LOC124613459 [Schistocerca americana]